MVTDDTATDRASVFRSFNPEINGRGIFEYSIMEYRDNNELQLVKSVSWTADALANKFIDDLHLDQLTYKNQCLEGNSLNTRYAGEIVITEIDNTVIDGAFAASSYYLLMISGSTSDRHLVLYSKHRAINAAFFAWIPEKYRSLADDAIAVNCVDCIGWFEKMYPKEYEQFNQNWLSLTLK